MPHPVDKGFIRHGKDYTTLICYKKAVIIYDITFYFAHKYLEREDRRTLTRDHLQHRHHANSASRRDDKGTN